MSDDYSTPKDFYEKLNAKYHFDFDPCPLNPSFDGLKISWGKRNFVNPPYSKPRPWIEKAIDESKNFKMSVMLLKSDTSTLWFHELLYGYYEIIFLKGRLKFGNSKQVANFPSMLVIIK